MHVREGGGNVVARNLVLIVQRRDVNAIILNNTKEGRGRHQKIMTLLPFKDKVYTIDFFKMNDKFHKHFCFVLTNLYIMLCEDNI